jgi:hypothetical protein
MDDSLRKEGHLMKRHYHRFKGYRRYPGRRGRPVYYVQMDAQEIEERRLLYGLIGALIAIVCAGLIWVVSMI